ncbi:K02A2.6-like, partial [Cordylochernes scorpioides]
MTLESALHMEKNVTSADSQTTLQIAAKNRAIRCIQEIEEEKDNLLIIDSIMVGQVLRKPWKELIYIQGHPVDIKLDTGADVNILPESLIKEWPNMPLLETADCKIYTYTGQQIPVVGKCLLDCKTKYACRKVTFLIVNNSAVPILGLDECVKLNLVKRVETISDISVTLTGLLDEYKDVFKGNGHLSYTYDIKISDKAEPKICPARRLPRALLQPVKEELFKMEEDGIIKKIEEPTVWAHPMVVVKKPSGKYRIYDLLIWGNSIEDHNSTLKKVLDLARESRLKLTLNKLQMATGEVKFLGHAISQEGILPDQDKVRAIQNMQIPKNKQELQRILGTVTYLAKFIPDLSSNTSNMRNLLKKVIIWNWDIAADQELNFIKTLLTSPPVLRHFDPNEPLELFADASKDGLGDILMQKEKPLSYASASLTSPQKHYSQIEKELLALYFGCKRFHYFLYGRKFFAYTDHKPLVSLLKKNFDQMSPRLQRLSLYLLNYQFDLKFIPGKSMIPADTLSRHFLPQVQMEDKELDLCSQTFVLNVEIKDQRLTRLQEDTLNDKECCLLKQYILSGWPLHKKNLPSNLKPYWEFKEELHEWQNLICRGNKLLIPKTQRSDILKILHASHQGINNTIALAKGFIYWPGMYKEIEELINNCSICQQTSRANLKEPLLPHQAPEYPWQKVGIDIFQIESSKYLLIVDYFSKYPEIYQLQDMTTDTIIRRLKRTFSNFGIPETLVSDNGSPFFSKEFQNFTRTWNIVHVTSSPYHAQSNGMVERTVQTLKKLIKRCGEESTDPYLALLNLRNTPHNNLPSPAQILMSRKLRSMIPSKTSQFVPSMINNEAIQKQLVDNQVKMKNYYDRHTRPADPLSINDRVWFRKDKRWIPGQLKNQANEPRSFYVKDQEGNEYRRNSIHIREDKRSETTHTDWEKPLELNQEQADLQDLEETPSQPTSSGQLSSPGSLENVTTTGPPESCTNGSPGNLITTRSGRVFQSAERYWKTLHALTVPLGYYRFDPRLPQHIARVDRILQEATRPQHITESRQDNPNEGHHSEEGKKPVQIEKRERAKMEEQPASPTKRSSNLPANKRLYIRSKLSTPQRHSRKSRKIS